MPRGTSLTELLTMLRAEAGHSTNVAVGVDNVPALMQKLVRAQTMLYDEYDWPFLRETFQVPLQQNTRYYDLPTSSTTNSKLNMERIEEVAINYSGRPVPIDRGIDFVQYAQYNSDEAQTASPCRCWDIKSTRDSSTATNTTTDQIEVWPIPTDNTQILSFRGIRQLRPLVNPSDVCDLDDILIVLTAAAEILARAKLADADEVKKAASARLAQMKIRTKGASRDINLAGSTDTRSNLGRTIIRIGSQTNA